MKRILLTLCLFSSLPVFAHQEFTARPQEEPLESTLQYNRSCFQELKVLGCSHPTEDQEYFINCFQSNTQMISSGCQTFFTTLYGQ